MSTLTEKEIIILRFMSINTKSADYMKKLSASDDYARQEIALYKARRMPLLTTSIKNMTANLAEMKEELAALS